MSVNRHQLVLADGYVRHIESWGRGVAGEPAAQWEIRQFALAVCRIVAEEFPQTWALYHAKRERRESWKSFAERVKITVSKIRSDKEDGLYAKLYAADMEQMLLHLQDG